MITKIRSLAIASVPFAVPFLASAQSMDTTHLESALGTSTTFAIAAVGILITKVFLVLGVTIAVGLGIGLLYWGIRKALGAVHGKV